MPRIDPIQLLKCLSVLLSPSGGIKSNDEVERLASLMTKFSKKLVSKCIYIQILKCTETDLLGLFMGSGGWRLVHMWLTESIVAKNWPLVRELLELLLLCPVDVERLKTNNCPKLVKELSKDGNHYAIRALASKLVEQWLKAVKGEQVTPISVADIPEVILDFQSDIKCEISKNDVTDIEAEKLSNDLEKSSIIENDKEVKSENDVNSLENVNNNDENDAPSNENESLPVLKITLKNGKQILSQVEDDRKASEDDSEKEKNREKHKSKNRDKSQDKSSSNKESSNSSRSSSSRRSSSSSKSSDKGKSSSHKDSSSKHSSKDKYKDKDRHSSHSSKSKSSSSSSSKKSSSSSNSSSSSKVKDEKSSQKHSSDKDKSREKDKDSKSSSEKSDSKTQTPSIQKLGKIPKLSDVKKEKPSISIEIRKPDEPKPKTVKTFHSKFRNHGLAEEIKPPPSRATLLNKKPPPAIPPTVSIPKRPSPVHNETPPEKKPKTLLEIDKPGAIKLIPPKHKPMVLQESDMFMDALNASATNKKEPKKRKRRTSGSKDAQSDGSPPQTPTSASSPNSESKSVPPRFYQDTLDEEDNKDKPNDKQSDVNENAEKTISNEVKPEEDMDISEPHTLTINGLKGILCYHKRKGPKKNIRWKPDTELKEIQYFELDETERVNVTKTFKDLKNLERIHEREAFQKARNLSNDDIMEERTSWRPLILVDGGGQVKIEYGKSSTEKDTQAIRQKGTLQPLYFHKSMIPDSPHEPDVETHTYAEPQIIPLEDVTGNQDNISDFRTMPWPEPKGNAPPTTSNSMNVPTMFPSNMTQFPNNFPAPPFPGVPGFQGPPIIPGEWQNGAVPPMMPNGMPGPLPTPGMPPGPMPPANMPPGMMGPPDNMMMGPEMFGNPNPMFPPVPPDGFNMQPNMFPVDYNMPGPPGPDGFPGPGNFRGAMRGRGAGGHWRGKVGGNWEGPQRGRGGRGGGVRKAVCIYFQRKGSCRQGDNCSFLHPGVNCPF